MGNGDLGLRGLAEAYAYGIAYAVKEQCSDAYGTFQPAVFALACFGYAQMQGIVHAFLLHLAAQKAYALYHDDGIGCLDADNDVGEMLTLCDAEKFHATFHDSVWGVAVA